MTYPRTEVRGNKSYTVFGFIVHYNDIFPDMTEDEYLSSYEPGAQPGVDKMLDVCFSDDILHIIIEETKKMLTEILGEPYYEEVKSSVEVDIVSDISVPKYEIEVNKLDLGNDLLNDISELIKTNIIDIIKDKVK